MWDCRSSKSVVKKCRTGLVFVHEVFRDLIVLFANNNVLAWPFSPMLKHIREIHLHVIRIGQYLIVLVLIFHLTYPRLNVLHVQLVNSKFSVIQSS